MLVLTRSTDQEIRIGDDIVVRVLDIRGDRVRIGIDAPHEVPVHRQEIYIEIEKANRAALEVAGAGLAGAQALLDGEVEKRLKSRKQKAKNPKPSSRPIKVSPKVKLNTEVSDGS